MVTLMPFNFFSPLHCRNLRIFMQHVPLSLLLSFKCFDQFGVGFFLTKIQFVHYFRTTNSLKDVDIVLINWIFLQVIFEALYI